MSLESEVNMGMEKLKKEVAEVKEVISKKKFFATMQQYLDMMGCRAYNQNTFSTTAAATDIRLKNVNGYLQSINVNCSIPTTSIEIFIGGSPNAVFAAFSEKDVSFQLNKFTDGDIVVRITPAAPTTGLVVADYYNLKGFDISKLM